MLTIKIVEDIETVLSNGFWYLKPSSIQALSLISCLTMYELLNLLTFIYEHTVEIQ